MKQYSILPLRAAFFPILLHQKITDTKCKKKKHVTHLHENIVGEIDTRLFQLCICPEIPSTKARIQK